MGHEPINERRRITGSGVVLGFVIGACTGALTAVLWNGQRSAPRDEVDASSPRVWVPTSAGEVRTRYDEFRNETTISMDRVRLPCKHDWDEAAIAIALTYTGKAIPRQLEVGLSIVLAEASFTGTQTLYLLLDGERTEIIGSRSILGDPEFYTTVDVATLRRIARAESVRGQLAYIEFEFPPEAKSGFLAFADAMDPPRPPPAQPEAAPPPPPRPAAPASPLPAAPDRLRLTDGRVLRGRLVSESEISVVFVVIAGRIESEMRFARSEVAGIDRDMDPGKP